MLIQVTVSTQLTDLRAYLENVTKITNFKCLTPPEALRGDCHYLCATLYACSIFGEHVLGNLCLEKASDDAPVSGHVRIRAKTQGMAVTMGDKVNLLLLNKLLGNVECSTKIYLFLIDKHLPKAMERWETTKEIWISQRRCCNSVSNTWYIVKKNAWWLLWHSCSLPFRYILISLPLSELNSSFFPPYLLFWNFLSNPVTFV